MSLRRHSSVAATTATAALLAGDLVRLVTMMIMARLLTPQDYGDFALASSAMLWAGAAGFENFAPNILRHRSCEVSVGTYLVFGLALESFLVVVGIVVAAFVYFSLEYELVGTLLAIGLLSFPLRVPQQIECQLLQREFRWGRLRAVELGTLLLGCGVSIFLAYKGAGPFALIAPVVLQPLPFAAFLFASRKVRPLRCDWELMRDVRTFGWPMAGGTITWRTRELLTLWAVGAVLGGVQLGLLGRAASLATLLVGRVSGYATYALLPILVAVQDDAARRLRVGNLLFRLVVWSQLPLAVCLILLADPIVHLLYGQRWAAVIDLLPFTSALAFVLAVQSFFMPLLIAVGATRARLVCDVIFLICAAFATGSLVFGLRAFILAITVAALIATLYAGYAAHRAGWLDLKGNRSAVVPAGTAVALAALASWPMWQPNIGTVWVIPSAIIFLFVYVACLRFLFAPELEEVISILPRPELLRRVLLFTQSAVHSPQG